MAYSAYAWTAGLPHPKGAAWYVLVLHVSHAVYLVHEDWLKAASSRVLPERQAEAETCAALQDKLQ